MTLPSHIELAIDRIETLEALIEKLYIFLDTSREGFNNDELEGLLIEINEL